MNLIEISPVVIEIRGAEYGELAAPVNNTLVHHMAFLAADTRPCVLIVIHLYICETDYFENFPYILHIEKAWWSGSFGEELFEQWINSAIESHRV